MTLLNRNLTLPTNLNGLKINSVNTEATGNSIGQERIDQMKQNLLSNSVVSPSSMNTANITSMSEQTTNALNEINNLSLNHDQNIITNEQRQELELEMENLQNEVESMTVIIFKKSDEIKDENTYVKDMGSEITINKMSNDSILKIGTSTIPSNLETIEDESSYSTKVQQLLTDNKMSEKLSIKSDGPLVITKSALDITEKIEKENNFNEQESRQFEDAVSQILGVQSDELDDVKIIDKVETSNSDTDKFYSYNELNNEDKDIYSSNVILLQTNDKAKVEISKLTEQLVKTNYTTQSVADILQIKPKRRMSFCSKREFKVLASYLKYKKDEFDSVALKLRIKHHKVTDFAPVYKNGIYVRFARRSDKLEKGERFMTKRINLVVF